MISFYQNMYAALQGLQQEIAQLSLSNQEASSVNTSIGQVLQLIQSQIWELGHEPEN